MKGGSQWTVSGRTHYERNKAAYVEAAARRKIAIRNYLRQKKEESGCVDCGIQDWRVLDFDHLGDKAFTLARAPYKGWGWSRIDQEIAKCEVRCSNCHRIKTWERSNASEVLTDTFLSSKQE